MTYFFYQVGMEGVMKSSRFVQTFLNAGRRNGSNKTTTGGGGAGGEPVQ